MPLRAQTLDPTVADNPFLFQTKWRDLETGLVYYGQRYYSPSQGRFLGRDPKQEGGGLNLFGFCRNNSINLWDYLGMTPNQGPVVMLPAFVVTAGRKTGEDSGLGIPLQQYADAPSGGGGVFDPFTARTPLPLSILNTITAPDGMKLVIVSSGGTDANGNPVWNAVPLRQFLLAQAAANLAAATANVNASQAALNISAGQIAANFAQGIAVGAVVAAAVVVTGPVGGAILLGVALGGTVPTYASMNGNPGAYSQQDVLNFTAGNVGAVIGGAGASQLPGFNAPMSNLNLDLPTSGLRLADGEARLILTRDGQLVASESMDAMLTHMDFARQQGALNSDGSLQAGYWIGTVVREGGTTLAFNSQTFYNNQNINAGGTGAVGGGFGPEP
jgi:RHS repeat-associated protein